MSEIKFNCLHQSPSSVLKWMRLWASLGSNDATFACDKVGPKLLATAGTAGSPRELVYIKYLQKVFSLKLLRSMYS